MSAQVVRIAALAAVFGLLSFGAGAGELRPLDQSGFCLDGGTEVRPSLNRITLKECNQEQTQNFRRGQKNTIYVGSLCLQAFSVEGASEIGVMAAPCHGGAGQRWVMTRDGRLSSGNRLCLTVTGAGTAASLAMTSCKEPTEDQTGQKWAIYGRF